MSFREIFSRPANQLKRLSVINDQLNYLIKETASIKVDFTFD